MAVVVFPAARSYMFLFVCVCALLCLRACSLALLLPSKCNEMTMTMMMIMVRGSVTVIIIAIVVFTVISLVWICLISIDGLLRPFAIAVMIAVAGLELCLVLNDAGYSCWLLRMSDFEKT